MVMPLFTTMVYQSHPTSILHHSFIQDHVRFLDINFIRSIFFLDRYPNEPTYDQRLRRFDDGVRTDYQSDFNQPCKSKYQYSEGQYYGYNKQSGYGGEKYGNKPDYYQPPNRPRRKNQIALIQLHIFISFSYHKTPHAFNHFHY